MTDPAAWECVIWEQVLGALVEGRKTCTSYYVMAGEMVSRCRRLSKEGIHER